MLSITSRDKIPLGVDLSHLHLRIFEILNENRLINVVVDDELALNVFVVDF